MADGQEAKGIRSDRALGTISLIQERQRTHGDAWKLSGVLLSKEVTQELIHKLPPQYVTAWMMILIKLVRAAFAPSCKEHWIDIQGYAQLVLNDIDRIEVTIEQ